MPDLSHTQCVKLRKAGGGIILVQGEESGKPFYAYLVAGAALIKNIQKACKGQGEANLLECERVITRGWGEEPPTHVKKGMEEKYGFVH